MLTEKQDRFPNVLHLVRILLVFPVALAHIKHKFFYTKRALEDWWLNIASRTLEHMLWISAEGPKPEAPQPER